MYTYYYYADTGALVMHQPWSSQPWSQCGVLFSVSWVQIKQFPESLLWSWRYCHFNSVSLVLGNDQFCTFRLKLFTDLFCWHCASDDPLMGVAGCSCFVPAECCPIWFWSLIACVCPLRLTGPSWLTRRLPQGILVNPWQALQWID